MAYFLEYETGVSAGHFTLDGVDFSSVLAKAKEALRGLDCTRAALLYSAQPFPVYGQGCVLATYTQSHGWIITGVWAQSRACLRIDS